MRCCGTCARRRWPVDYPDNGAYMVAAYIVAAVVILSYSISLWMRIRKEQGAGRREEGKDS